MLTALKSGEPQGGMGSAGERKVLTGVIVSGQCEAEYGKEEYGFHHVPRHIVLPDWDLEC